MEQMVKTKKTAAEIIMIKIFLIAELIAFWGVGAFFINVVINDVENDPHYIWSYIYYASDFFTVFFSIGNMIMAIVAFKKLKEPSNMKFIWRMVVVMKLTFLPIMIASFFMGSMFIFFALMFVITLPMGIVMFIVCWFALMASSSYCIVFLIHAKLQKQITWKRLIVQILLQLCFGLDLLGLIWVRKVVVPSWKNVDEGHPQSSDTSL